MTLETSAIPLTTTTTTAPEVPSPITTTLTSPATTISPTTTAPTLPATTTLIIFSAISVVPELQDGFLLIKKSEVFVNLG